MNLKEKVLIRKDLEQGNYTSLLDKVEEILLKEKNAYNFYLKARALYNLGRYNDSLDAIKQALAYPDASDELLLLAGRIYFHLNYFKKAEEFYIHAIKKKESYTEAYAAYAFLLFVTGFDDKSELMLGRAIKLEEENIFTLITWFKIALYKKRKIKEAYGLEKILSEETGERYRNIHAALIYAKRGERNKAKNFFKLVEGSKHKPKDLDRAFKEILKIKGSNVYALHSPNKSNFNHIYLLLFCIAGLVILYKLNLIKPALMLSVFIALYALATIINILRKIFDK